MENAHVAALIEEFRGQFKVFGELVQGTNDKVDRLAERVGSLEDKVGGLTTTVNGLVTDTAEVKDRLTRVEHAVNGKPPRKRKT